MNHIIHVDQGEDGKFTADRPKLPGSPRIGHGRTWREAVGDLLINAQGEFGVQVIRVFDKKGRPYRFKSKHRR